jgi:hypothetical protein
MFSSPLLRPDPVAAPSTVFTVNGLVGLLPLNNEFLLAMERSFSVGAGNTIGIENVEGMTLGPTLPDGRRSVLLVSDNSVTAGQASRGLLLALG